MIYNKFRISMLIFTVWLLSSLWAISAYSQGFDACLAHYAEGNDGWCKLSDDVFNNVRLTDAEANSFGVKGSIGSRAVMIAWNGAALDPDRLIMYFFGGGHNDYYGNEWYAYDIRAGKFERLNDPSPLTHYYFVEGNNYYCRIPDPEVAPNSTHTYDGVQFNPETGTIFLVGSGNSAYCGGQPATGALVERNSGRAIYEFNPSKTEVRNGLDPLTYRKSLSHGYTYPRSAFIDGTMIFGSNTVLYEYPLVNGVLTEGARYFGNAPAGQGFADSIDGGVAIYMSAGYFWTGEDGEFTRHRSGTWIPYSGGMACGIGECLFWAGEKVVTVWDKDDPATHREIDHDTGPEGGDKRVYSKIQYIPAYNLYVGVSNVNQPVYLYKVDGAEIPDPIPGPDPDPDPVPDQTPEPEPTPDPEPAPDPTPDPAPEPGFSDWMVDPEWSTLTEHPPIPGLQDEIITVRAGSTLFIVEIDKDAENNVFVVRAVGRARVTQLTDEQSAAIKSVFGDP